MRWWWGSCFKYACKNILINIIIIDIVRIINWTVLERLVIIVILIGKRPPRHPSVHRQAATRELDRMVSIYYSIWAVLILALSFVRSKLIGSCGNFAQFGCLLDTHENRCLSI